MRNGGDGCGLQTRLIIEEETVVGKRSECKVDCTEGDDGEDGAGINVCICMYYIYILYNIYFNVLDWYTAGLYIKAWSLL